LSKKFPWFNNIYTYEEAALNRAAFFMPLQIHVHFYMAEINTDQPDNNIL